MTPPTPIEEIKKIFHEPNRLAILSALAAAPDGLPFVEMKTTCRLTDGNLSRHLKALSDLDVVRVKKTFAGAKPRTTVFLTDRGRARFVRYLSALEEVLQTARTAVRGEAPPRIPASDPRPAGAA